MDNQELIKIEMALAEKKLSHIDKIKGYLFGRRKKIVPKLEKQLEKYLKIQQLRQKKYTKSQVIAIIQNPNFFEEGLKISIRQAYTIYNNSIEVFGDVYKINKEAERYFSHEKYVELAQKAEDDGDYETAGRLREKADKLYGLFDDDKKEDVKPSLYFQNVTIVRSSDPDLFKKKQEEKIKKRIQLDD
jgi:hypothetical protein